MVVTIVHECVCVYAPPCMCIHAHMCMCLSAGAQSPHRPWWSLQPLPQGIVQAYQSGDIVLGNTTSMGRWELVGSFFFSVSTVTTIGKSRMGPEWGGECDPAPRKTGVRGPVPFGRVTRSLDSKCTQAQQRGHHLWAESGADLGFAESSSAFY